MTKAELYGGPMDGRTFDVPDREPVLRVPVPLVHQPLPYGNGVSTGVLVARYVRCDHLDGRISYRYQGQEQL